MQKHGIQISEIVFQNKTQGISSLAEKILGTHDPR